MVRTFGHDLKKLCHKADQISVRHKLCLNYPKPADQICWRIVNCLASFAEASKGRYANFEAIGNPAFDPAIEPVNKWWREVVDPILDKHYRGSASEQSVKHRAAALSSLMEGHVAVFYIDETGRSMSDIAMSSERTGQTPWAQKFGRYYTLCVVRWLADIFSKLAHFATYEKSIHALFGHHEFFDGYCTEDSYLFKRKVWPLV